MNIEYAPEIRRIKNADLHILRPENPISPYPIIFVPGFGNEASAYRIALQELFLQGFTVSCADYKYGTSDEPKSFGLIPNIEKLKRGTIGQSVEELGFVGENGQKQAHLVAHSKGFIDAITYALQNPDSVKSITGVAPGGLHKKQWLIAAIKEAKSNEKKDNEDKACRIKEEPIIRDLILGNEEFKRWWEKQSLRYKLEGLTAATKTVQDKLSILRGKGIIINLVLLENDSMNSSVSKVEEVLKEGMTDEVIKMPGIHGEVKFGPLVAREIAEILKTNEGII